MRPLLQGFEEAPDFGIGPVLFADELAADYAFAVDYVGFRPHFGAEELGDGLVGIADSDQVHMTMVDEPLVLVLVLIDADGDHGQVGPVVVELDQRWRFLNAGCAPGGPEIEHNHFAAIVGQVDGGASVGDGKVGRWGGELGGVGAAIAGGEQAERESDDEGEETRGPHTPIIRSGRPQRKGGLMREENSDKVGASGPGRFKPVLGLSDEVGEPVAMPERWGARPGTVYDQPEPEQLIELTVIVPARNEEGCLGACLESLVGQSEEIFELGQDWELVVVDDHSTDKTLEIARSFAGVTVMPANDLETGWTGKANAIWTAARKARGRWLLFTDADTVHEPGDLRRAIHEAQRNKVGMLSYSPRQLVRGLLQRSLMPLVFCELALAYPPAKVSDPNQRIAAANGQFLLVEREAYRRLGGHASVADRVLEDVELAVLAKRRKVGLRFRYADDAVSTRMYRTTAAMLEGWTKNLALLFANSLALAVWRALDIVLLLGLPVLTFELWNGRFGLHSLEWLSAGWVLALLWLRTVFRFYARVAKSNFPFVDCALSPLGLPLFVVLLYRSWFQHRILKRVSWKGREISF